MENDPVKCFQHCDTDVNILCLGALPEICPVCGQDVYSTPSKIPPFRMQSPFVDSMDVPYSVVIKPTKGNFLNEYNDGDDLHIGITDSRGVVYDFNQGGVNRREEGWSQCLGATITQEHQYQISAVWDAKLTEFSAYDRWTPESYSESSHNCYTFVLGFLDLLQSYAALQLPCRVTREEFSRSMVLPLTTKAAKYISLYRGLIKEVDGVSVTYNTAL